MKSVMSWRVLAARRRRRVASVGSRWWWARSVGSSRRLVGRVVAGEGDHQDHREHGRTERRQPGPRRALRAGPGGRPGRDRARALGGERPGRGAPPRRPRRPHRRHAGGRRVATDLGEPVADPLHRPALGRLPGHRGPEQLVEGARVRQPRRLLVHDLVEPADQVVAHVVRRLAGQHVEERRAQRPDVAGRARAGAGGDLGREVGRRPGDEAGLGEAGVGLGPGDAEVGELRLPVGGQQDVGRLDVAVGDAGAVGRGRGRRRPAT